MEQQSIRKATEIITDAIQNSDINVVDKYELLMNLYVFLTNYDEAIKHRFEKENEDGRKVTKNR